MTYRNWTATEKKLSSVIYNNEGADQPAHRPNLISNFVIYFLRRIISRLATSENFNFLASLFCRGDWFETRFVGNPDDRFSHVMASYISVKGQILQVQQIIIFKKILRRLFIRYVKGGHTIWLGSTSPNTQLIRNHSPQSEKTLILWLQVHGMALY